MHRLPRHLVVGVLCLLVALAAAACGGDDDDSSSGSAPTTALPADALTIFAADINFPQKEFTAPAGEVTIQYVNDPGVAAHTLVIEGVDKAKFYLEISGSGDTDTGTVALEPGTYIIFCDIPAHRGAGMEGTLTVS